MHAKGTNTAALDGAPLEESLLWTQHKLSSALSDLANYRTMFESAEDPPVQELQALVAWTVSFIDVVNDLREQLTSLQADVLERWESLFDIEMGETYWPRMAALHENTAATIREDRAA